MAVRLQKGHRGVEARTDTEPTFDGCIPYIFSRPFATIQLALLIGYSIFSSFVGKASIRL